MPKDITILDILLKTTGSQIKRMQKQCPVNIIIKVTAISQKHMKLGVSSTDKSVPHASIMAKRLATQKLNAKIKRRDESKKTPSKIGCSKYEHSDLLHKAGLPHKFDLRKTRNCSQLASSISLV